MGPDRVVWPAVVLLHCVASGSVCVLAEDGD